MSRNSIAAGTISITIASLIFMVSGYLLNIWLGRYLGPRDYGTFGVVLTLWNTVNLFITTGIPQAVSKFIASSSGQSSSVFKSGFILQSFICSLVTILYWLASPLLGDLFHDSSLVAQIRYSSLIFIPYGLYSLYFNYYNGLHFFSLQARINIIYSVLKLVGVLSLAHIIHLPGVYLGYALAPLLSAVVMFELPKFSAPSFSAKKLIIFSLPVTFMTIFVTLQQSIDLLSIKSLLGSSSQAGLYTAIQNIAFIPYYALGAISVVIFPGIAKEISNNSPDRVRSLIYQSLRFTLIIAALLVVLISTTSHFLTNLLFSVVYLPASPALAYLVIAYGFFTISRLLTNILAGDHQLMPSLISSVIGFIVSVISCYLLVPRFGLVGAAVSTILASFSSLVILAFYTYKRFQQLIPLMTFFRLAISVALTVLTSLLYFHFFPVTLFSYPLLSLVYLFLLLTTGVISRGDLNLIKSLFPGQTSFSSDSQI